MLGYLLQELTENPHKTLPSVADGVRNSTGPRLSGKLNYPNPNKVNPGNTGTHSNFNKAFMDKAWFQQKYLIRKQIAERSNQVLYDFKGERIPYQRGSRYQNIGAGTIGHTHTGLHGTPGSILNHKYDNTHLHPLLSKVKGIPVYSPQ